MLNFCSLQSINLNNPKLKKTYFAIHHNRYKRVHVLWDMGYASYFKNKFTRSRTSRLWLARPCPARCSVRHGRHCHKMDRQLRLGPHQVLYGCPHTRDSLRTTCDLILKFKLNLHLHGFIQSCWSFYSKVTSYTDSTIEVQKHLCMPWGG